MLHFNDLESPQQQGRAAQIYPNVLNPSLWAESSFEREHVRIARASRSPQIAYWLDQPKLQGWLV